ncbi:MAG: ECF transporter S component [Oscillospiraceae bacterium]|jgi:uncharacterized membrane protein|nr:ECF transporter S component [Oscillospiraceae bacterium]
MNIRKITVGGLLIALSVLLPQAFHLIGSTQAGKMFLPMHIPVLLGGMILGPMFGMLIGTTAPLISALLTGMPLMVRLPFMIIELAGYGFASGSIYKTIGFCNRKYGTVMSLVIAMLFGRILYALTLFVAADILDITALGAFEAVKATIAGVYGIILQLLIIPALVYTLRKVGFYDLFNEKGKAGAS